MKLATLKDGSRDGQLIVVSRDLALAHLASGIATRLQQALDDWNFIAPQLEDLSATLNGGKARHAFAFDPRQCMAPLPRSYQWSLAGAAAPAAEARSGDAWLGAHDDAFFFDADAGIDLGAGLAVITGDVPMGATPEQALEGVRLLLLVNAWALREAPALPPPASAAGPVAVTPDELGAAWSGGLLRLPLASHVNERLLGAPDAGQGPDGGFGAVLSRLARTRGLRAGSVVGAGTVGEAGAADATRGFGSLADKRAHAAGSDGGAPRSAWLRFGDRVRIEMKGRDGQSVFGAIEQTVTGPAAAMAAADGAPPSAAAA
ncbi:MAG: fumarylacetoacetate hydrolase family protein [Proteobacteria bacterium]|nr:fumarylacetoacetate hydrolase family protein [Pseudomonadota bacterium]